VVATAAAAVAIVVAVTLVVLRGPDVAAAPVPWRTPTPVPASQALPPLTVSDVPSPGAPTESGITHALGSTVDDPALGGDVGLAVVDGSGRSVYDRGGGVPLAPASTLKLLTATSALEVVGPYTRFQTTVVPGARDGDVVLVGGGDPSLTRKPAPGRAHAGPGASVTYPDPARLPDLATRAARTLKARGATAVRLRIDDALFGGPTQSPHWPSSYVSGGNVAPVTALSVDAGRRDPAERARERDPSLAAGRLFAHMLEQRGITVRGQVSRATAPEGAKPLAAVDSPSVAALVESMLTRSDNDIAENLLRHVARGKGRPATFTGGTRAVGDILSALGVDTSGLRMYDGSGLSRDDRVPPRLLAHTLAVDVSSKHPELRSVVTGLPVAGFTGTLDYRFGTGSVRSGAGIVRAKTGTLTGVSALAGVVQDASGRLLVFAALADRVSGAEAAESALDRIASALVPCGCAPTPSASATPSS